MKKGDRIQFTAARIMKGNPIIGKLINYDNEWIEVELDHQIHGVANIWEAGERKLFRICFINGSIKTLDN